MLCLICRPFPGERFPQFDDETKITDAEIQTTGTPVAALCGVTDAESVFPYMPDAEPPVYTRKIALYFALCHLLTIQGRADRPDNQRLRAVFPLPFS